MATHHYELTVRWTGNQGQGTATYKAYTRDHEITAPRKATVIQGSSDPAYRGDAGRYNPEDLLVGSASACHMLWVLHLAADAGIVITDYVDDPIGVMRVNPDGSGEFEQITLRPQITITDPARVPDLAAIHHRAHAVCAIARSLKCPVVTEPRAVVTAAA